jgi:membrane-bound ClpP family serine protease
MTGGEIVRLRGYVHQSIARRCTLPDFLLIPDVSYLIIVGGFLLAVLALFAPGTGVIEIAAISAILLGGYGIISLPINIWALIILLIGVIPFVFAVRKSGQIGYLIVAIVALGVGSSYIYSGTAWYVPGVHPLLAAVISILAGCFMWLVARKSLEALAIKPRNKLDELVGATGETQMAVNLIDGSVYVGGENWSARSQHPIPANVRVKVLKREGFVLEVEELQAGS